MSIQWTALRRLEQCMRRSSVPCERLFTCTSEPLQQTAPPPPRRSFRANTHRLLFLANALQPLLCACVPSVIHTPRGMWDVAVRFPSAHIKNLMFTFAHAGHVNRRVEGSITIPQLIVPILYLLFGSRPFSILLPGDVPFILDSSMVFLRKAKTHLSLWFRLLNLEYGLLI